MVKSFTYPYFNSTDYRSLSKFYSYRSLTDPLVIRAMHYIRHRACHRIKVEQVLDHLETSRSNLEQRFKNEMNKTIHQVIHEEKNFPSKRIYYNKQIFLFKKLLRFAAIHPFNILFCFKKEFEMTQRVSTKLLKEHIFIQLCAIITSIFDRTFI